MRRLPAVSEDGAPGPDAGMPLGLIALNADVLSPADGEMVAPGPDEVERMLGKAAAVDAAEDEQCGDARGDELPGELVDRHSRLERLRRCRDELEAEQAKAEAAEG